MAKGRKKKLEDGDSQEVQQVPQVVSPEATAEAGAETQAAPVKALDWENEIPRKFHKFQKGKA